MKGTWVQTERQAHEKWATLIRNSPKAAQLLHLLVANMDKSGAVVISQSVLAEMMGAHRNTIGRAVKVLTKNNWIEVVRIGGKQGGVKVYMINRRVAWADKRDKQCRAVFDARVVVSASEQDVETLENVHQLEHLPFPTGLKSLRQVDSDGDAHHQKELFNKQPKAKKIA